MQKIGKQALITILFLLLLTSSKAQSQLLLKGVVVQEGTKSRVTKAVIYNQKTRYTAYADKLGMFQIPSVIGDTLEISCEGHLTKYFNVTNFDDVIITLQLSNNLSEVIIKGTNKKYSMAEVSDRYSKEKGVFYGGKPPLILLNPFGGKPITFFHELLGKDAKHVRRLNKLSAREAVDNEIETRFNNTTIKRILPIDDKDLEKFKSDYWPNLNQIRKWSDYELFDYIKKSYIEYKEKNP